LVYKVLVVGKSVVYENTILKLKLYRNSNRNSMQSLRGVVSGVHHELNINLSALVDYD